MNNNQLIEQGNKTRQMVEDIYIPERTSDFISPYLSLPGLIGFWPMATVQRSTGNVPNYAPTYTGATKQDLVYNGNPTFNYTATGVPYIDLDGIGDYLSIADNTDLDILGTETQYANPGLTMGGWFWLDTTPGATSYGLIGKWNINNASYLIRQSNTNLGFFVSANGVASFSTVTTSLNTSSWSFVVGKYIPSTSLTLYVNNNTPSVNATSIPAALFNGVANFEIGDYNAGATPFDGRVSLVFLSASALSDAIIQSLFQQTRSLFGV